MSARHDVPRGFLATATCGNCGKEFPPKRKTAGEFCSRACVSPGRSQLDEARIIRLYSDGMGLKAIAQEVIGRMSAKNTIRDALIRNGVEIRTVQQMANDPASKLRRLKGRGLPINRRTVFGQGYKPTTKTTGLELFDYSKAKQNEVRKSERNQKSRESHPVRFEEINRRARELGFKSEYHRRYELEPQFRLKEMMRRRFKKIAMGAGQPSARMLDLIGCTQDGFRRWIESQWEDWMNWGNIGKSVSGRWQIDHIIPCSWFNQEKQEDLEVCWHYLNLRPLCAVENNVRRDNPNKLIETIGALPDHPIKERMRAMAISRSLSGSHWTNRPSQGRRDRKSVV